MSTPEFQQKIKSFVKKADVHMDPGIMKSLLHGLGVGGSLIWGILKHKALDAGISTLARRTPLLKNFYANMSARGMHAGLNPSEQLAPRFRNAMGAVAFNPSVSGNVDYMMGQHFAHSAADKIFQETGKRITSIDELRKHPIAQAMHNMPQHVEQNSPITRNFLNALNPELPPSRLVNAIERFGGVGPDKQQWGGRAGLLGSAALGAINPFTGGGLHGAVANMITQAPETAATWMMNRKDSLPVKLLLRAGLAAKKRLMTNGFLEGLDGRQSQHFLNNGKWNYLNTTSGEVRALGGDLGSLTRAATSPQGIPGLPTATQKNIANLPNVLAPVTKMLGGASPEYKTYIDKAHTVLGDSREANYNPATVREMIRDHVHENVLGESYHANKRRNPGAPKAPLATIPASRPIDPISGREIEPSRIPRVKPAPNPFFVPTPIQQHV